MNNNKKLSFFLCERIPSENRGEAAILEGLVHGLRTVFGDFSLTIYSMRLQHDTAYYGKYGKIVGFSDADGLSSKILRVILSLELFLSALLTFVGLKVHFPGEMYGAFANADVILQGHDNVYRHEIKPKDALIAFWTKRHKKLLVIPGGSVGPFEFKSDLDKKFGMYVLNNADLITLRDPQSGEFLKKIGVTNDYIVLNDIAFMLQPEEVSNMPWSKEKGEIVIGFTPTNYVFQNARSASGQTFGKEAFLDEVRSYLKWLVDEYSARIVFIPHVYGPEKKQDDRLLIHKIISGSKLPEDKITVLDKEQYSAGQFKYLISKLDLLIACRTHTMIAALGQGTPVLAFTDPGRYKTNGILGNLFQLPEYMCDVMAWDQQKTREQTYEIILVLDKVKDKIAARRGEALRLAEENVRLIARKLY